MIGNTRALARFEYLEQKTLLAGDMLASMLGGAALGAQSDVTDSTVAVAADAGTQTGVSGTNVIPIDSLTGFDSIGADLEGSAGVSGDAGAVNTDLGVGATSDASAELRDLLSGDASADLQGALAASTELGNGTSLTDEAGLAGGLDVSTGNAANGTTIDSPAMLGVGVDVSDLPFGLSNGATVDGSAGIDAGANLESDLGSTDVDAGATVGGSLGDHDVDANGEGGAQLNAGTDDTGVEAELDGSGSVSLEDGIDGSLTGDADTGAGVETDVLGDVVGLLGDNNAVEELIHDLRLSLLNDLVDNLTEDLSLVDRLGDLPIVDRLGDLPIVDRVTNIVDRVVSDILPNDLSLIDNILEATPAVSLQTDASVDIRLAIGLL